MASQTPQRFSGRAGSNMPGRVRRALDAHIESKQRYGDTVEVAPSGRVETRLARNGGLKQTKEGLVVDLDLVGEKNHTPINRQQSLSNAATTAQVVTAYNELLKELRRTGRMRS